MVLGKTYLRQDLEDPAGKGADAVRPFRDEVRRRVESLVTELTASRSSTG